MSKKEVKKQSLREHAVVNFNLYQLPYIYLKLTIPESVIDENNHINNISDGKVVIKGETDWVFTDAKRGHISLTADDP